MKGFFIFLCFVAAILIMTFVAIGNHPSHVVKVYHLSNGTLAYEGTDSQWYYWYNNTWTVGPNPITNSNIKVLSTEDEEEDALEADTGEVMVSPEEDESYSSSGVGDDDDSGGSGGGDDD
jgi:hypothetical protein